MIAMCMFCSRGQPEPGESLKPNQIAQTHPCAACGIDLCADCDQHPVLPEGHMPEWHVSGVPAVLLAPPASAAAPTPPAVVSPVAVTRKGRREG